MNNLKWFEFDFVYDCVVEWDRNRAKFWFLREKSTGRQLKMRRNAIEFSHAIKL